jgi:hypothetical protein
MACHIMKYSKILAEFQIDYIYIHIYTLGSVLDI